VLAGRVPSLNVESSFGRAFPRFYIRGYGNGDFRLNASQPVSLIYDEVVQENPILKGFPIFDLDQIEVLRGPQGTLFGRNTPGGVVKFNSIRPSSECGGYVNVSDATYNTANIEGAINMPFGENWAARVSALYQHRDDYVGNSLTGDDDVYEGYNDRAARVQLQYDNDDFSALFNLHSRNLDGTARLFRANIIEAGGNDLIDDFDEDSPVFFDGANRQELDIAGGSIRLRWDFGDLALYSITGYESMEAYSRGDIDGGFGCEFCGVPGGPGFIPFPSETADAIPTLDQFTQELRLESQLDGAFNWQAGLYYFDEDYDTEFFSYDSVFGGGAQNQYLRANQTNIAWAAFGSVLFKIGPAFELRAGVRYTDDEKDFVTGEPDGFQFPDPAASTTASLSDDNVSWDLAGTWSVTEAVNLYARVATGFRGASVQPAGPFGNQSVAEPETNTSYEVGVKADLFDQKARLYFNLYHYEVKDQQLTAVGGANNAVRLLNADKTTGQGAELDFQAYVTPNLLVTLGASYNETEINDDDILVGVCFACTVTDPIVLLPPAPAPPPPQTPYAVIDGNPLPQAPEVIANFTLRYGVPVGNGELFFYTDWAYRSEVNFFLYESVEFTGKSLLEGGLRVGYNWSDEKYEAALFGRNITDEVVAVGGIDFNNLLGFVNEPQIWGVQFKARF
jgi:iron complex outermembrane recepter protein